MNSFLVVWQVTWAWASSSSRLYPRLPHPDERNGSFGADIVSQTDQVSWLGHWTYFVHTLPQFQPPRGSGHLTSQSSCTLTRWSTKTRLCQLSADFWNILFIPRLSAATQLITKLIFWSSLSMIHRNWRNYIHLPSKMTIMRIRLWSSHHLSFAWSNRLYGLCSYGQTGVQRSNTIRGFGYTVCTIILCIHMLNFCWTKPWPK